MRSRPRRFIRRTLAILLGLWLGWMAADVAFEQLPQGAAYGAAPLPAAANAGQPTAMQSIDALQPAGGSPWFSSLVGGIILLFVAAALLGPLALVLKDRDPPEQSGAARH